LSCKGMNQRPPPLLYILRVPKLYIHNLFI